MKQDTNSIKYKVLASLYNSSTYLHLRGSFWIQHWPLLGRSLGARHYQSHLWRIAALAVCTQWRGCRLSFGTCCPRDMLPYSGKGWRHSVQNSKNEAFIWCGYWGAMCERYFWCRRGLGIVIKQSFSRYKNHCNLVAPHAHMMAPTKARKKREPVRSLCTMSDFFSHLLDLIVAWVQ